VCVCVCAENAREVGSTLRMCVYVRERDRERVCVRDVCMYVCESRIRT